MYVVRLKSGKKIEIQKYPVGIAGFVAYAKDQIVQNRLM